MPVGVRAHLAHGALAEIARERGLDVLHVKGPAVHPGIGRPLVIATDADVVVRPRHVGRFIDALVNHGWEHVTSFETGSAFEHAATYYHASWGYADVHRVFPGMTDERAFDRLWRERQETDIAGIACPVPSLTAQRLLLLLHVARNGRGALDPDRERAWDVLDDDGRVRVRALAAEVGAQVGLAAALGELDHYVDDPSHDLWMVFSRGGATRLQEWRARFRAARGPWAKSRVLCRSFMVNTDHLAMALGRRPTRGEVVSEFLGRIAEAGRELAARGRRR